MGVMQFGTESFHTDGDNVTFEASGLDLKVTPKSVSPQGSNAVSLKGPEWLLTWRSMLGMEIMALIFGIWMM